MPFESIVVIPARLQSSRLPGKPLIDILGKSLIQRTYEQCIKAIDAKFVWVATDHEKIQRHCEALGMQVIMTSGDCLTGTDRVAEVATKIDADYYINVQGDEPVVNPNDIIKVINAAKQKNGAVYNGFAAIEDENMWLSYNTPKVVFREDKRLLYMSRAPIPGNKSGAFERGWRQICIYAYPVKALNDYVSRVQKTNLEAIEDLEMLRFLEMGYEVNMIELSSDSIAVDNPEDVETVIKRLQYENN